MLVICSIKRQPWVQTGCINEITPKTSSLPRSPPVATRATQPAQLTHPVIHDKIGIHLPQDTVGHENVPC